MVFLGLVGGVTTLTQPTRLEPILNLLLRLMEGHRIVGHSLQSLVGCVQIMYLEGKGAES